MRPLLKALYQMQISEAKGLYYYIIFCNNKPLQKVF